MPDLVWPVRRVMVVGFYGVQLFFLASAVTLMMSWHRSVDPLGLRSVKFLVRRFFRIAPLYWLAVVFYWFAYEYQSDQFSLQLLFATLFFYNAWSPYLIPTVPGWTPVPGGWSIGVEFCFYLSFPLIAPLVTSIRRALAFCAVSLGVLLAASLVGQGLYPEISMEQRANFLYFWPPNQLVIFSLGFLLYHLVKDAATRQRIIESRISADQASIALLGAMLAIALFIGLNKFFDWSRGLPPTHLLMTMCFMPWALVLILKPSGWVINRAITGLGKISFSAYVLHFAVLNFTGQLLHRLWPIAKTGIFSIAFEAVFLVIALLLIRVVGEASYRLIEQPFINLGKLLLATIHKPVAVSSAKQSG